jgi:hypothetical protein
VWAWAPFSNGLPEAPVHDLSFYSRDGIKLLRAAVQSLGVWEVDLSATPSPVRRTYLRAYPRDSRRRSPVVLTNSTDLGMLPEWSWHTSPDIRIRPAPLDPGEPIPFPPPHLAQFPWKGIGPSTFFLWVFQTALHNIDPLVRPDGRWSHQFIARLRAHDPTAGNTIDHGRWTQVVTPANVYMPPWEGSEPTEADLMELVVEFPGLLDFIPAVSTVLRRKHKIDVLIHHRDIRPVAKEDVRVTLLRREMSPHEPLWPLVAIPPDLKTRLQELLSGSPPPGWALPSPWRLADPAMRTRQPAGSVSARIPRAVTFDLDLSDVTGSGSQKILLMAVVHSTVDPATVPSLAGDTLRDLILRSHHVAARMIGASIIL